MRFQLGASNCTNFTEIHHFNELDFSHSVIICTAHCFLVIFDKMACFTVPKLGW